MIRDRREPRVEPVPALAALLLALTLFSACDREKTGNPAASTAPSTAQPVKATPAAAPEHYLPDTDAVAKPIDLRPPATRPSTSLQQDAACVTPECHATFASAAYVHQPIAQRDCYNCHERDEGGHVYPLKRKGTDTCTTCHAVTGKTAGAMQHAPVKAACVTCHDPHASKTKFLLKADSVQQLCTRCHNVPVKKVSHDPFAKGQCTACHQPHESANRSLLRGGDGAQHCLLCHRNVNDSFASATSTHKPAQTECMTCHSPHSTDEPYVLRKAPSEICLGCHSKVAEKVQTVAVKHDPVTMNKGCINCHSGHKSSEPKLLLARMDKLCLTCHTKPTKTQDGRRIAGVPEVDTAKFKHGPVRAGDCGGCHDAHGSANPNLLTSAFPDGFYTSFEIEKYQLCFNCHDRDVVTTRASHTVTGFRDGNLNLHYLHVNRDDKGRTCKACHAIHGSDLPNHMASEVPFEGSNWAMQINFTKSKTGGTCTPGCHKSQTYSRSAADHAIADVPTTQETTETPGPTTQGAP